MRQKIEKKVLSQAVVAIAIALAFILPANIIVVSADSNIIQAGNTSTYAGTTGHAIPINGSWDQQITKMVIKIAWPHMAWEQYFSSVTANLNGCIGEGYAQLQFSGSLTVKTVTITYNVGGHPAIPSGSGKLCNIVVDVKSTAPTPVILPLNLLQADYQYLSTVYHAIPINGTISIFATTPIPPNTPSVTGPDPRVGLPGQSMNFNASSGDGNGESIYYKWDWGNGTFSSWIGPYYYPNYLCTVAHTWSTAVQPAKVKAKTIDDPNGDGILSDGTESSWSSAYPVWISYPPETPDVSGPIGYPVGEPASFQLTAVDPDTAAPGTNQTQQLDLIVDWGTGSNQTFYCKSGVAQSTTHTWMTPGIYTITVYVYEHFMLTFPGTSYYGHQSNPIQVMINIGMNTPEIVAFDGPTEGNVGETQTFDLTIRDWDGDVQYFIDWGDGNDTYWLPEDGYPWGHETVVEETHTWDVPGDYVVRAKSRDLNNMEESNWTELTIHVNRLKVVSVSGGFGVSAQLKNVGHISKDVEWSVELVGGAFPGFHFNKYYNSSIQPLKSGETVTLAVGPVFGLGSFKITITATCAGEPVVTKTVNGLILFFYVIIR